MLLAIDHLLDLRCPVRYLPIALSPDGAVLALPVQPVCGVGSADEAGWATPHGVGRDLRASRIILIETNTGAASEPFPTDAVSMAPQWSPDGVRLAAFVQHGGSVCLGVWDRTTGSARLYRDATVRTGGWGMAEYPCWAPDGKSVFLLHVEATDLPVRPGEPWALRNRVRIFNTQGTGATETAANRFHFLEPPYRLARVDVDSGTMQVLDLDGSTIEQLRVSPDGTMLATFRPELRGPATGQRCKELVVYSTTDGSPSVVARGIPYSDEEALPSWSPSGERLAYVAGGWRGKTRLFIVAADGSQSQPEPRELAIAEAASRKGDYTGSRWSADGDLVYLQGEQGILECPVDGGAGRIIAPQRHRFVGWIQPPVADALVTRDGRAVIVRLRPDDGGLVGVAWLDLNDGGVTGFAEFPHAPFTSGGLHVDLARDGSAGYIVAASDTSPGEVYRFASDEPSRRLYACSTYPDGLETGAVRELRWRGSSGAELCGTLVLPPGYVEGQRLPLILEVYPGSVPPSTPGPLGIAGMVVEPRLLTAAGYAVFYPQIPIEGKDRYRQIPGPVLDAIAHLADVGVADPERVGVMGLSFGGYAVLALLTQTSGFKAAVCRAGFASMLRMYTELGPTGRAQWVDLCEHGQGNLGGSPWERRDAYIENSPFFFLDRVTAPLLIVCGTLDPSDQHGAEETFIGLRRLGKEAELRIYAGEGHAPFSWSRENYRDLTQRVLDWFDEHLQP